MIVIKRLEINQAYFNHNPKLSTYAQVYKQESTIILIRFYDMN